MRTHVEVDLAGKGTFGAGCTSVTMIVTNSVEFVPAILIKHLNVNYFCYKRWMRAIDEHGMATLRGH